MDPPMDPPNPKQALIKLLAEYNQIREEGTKRVDELRDAMDTEMTKAANVLKQNALKNPGAQEVRLPIRTEKEMKTIIFFRHLNPIKAFICRDIEQGVREQLIRIATENDIPFEVEPDE